MRTAVFGISTSLLLACAPDWSANETTRCTESAECGEAQLCYRGFCVIDPDAGISEEDADAGTEAGTVSTPATVSSTPAPAPSTATSPATPAASADAGSTVAGNDKGDAQEPPNAPASNAGPADAGSAGSSTSSGHDAGASTKPAATQPNPPTNPNAGPAKPPAMTAPDAGATEPEMPGDCTLAKCCEEALKALEREEREGDDKGAKGPGKCGCAEPELLRVLGCGLLAPVGALL